MLVKIKKLRESSDNDLMEKLKEARLELSKDLAASEIGTAKSPARIKNNRKTIARILTLLNERKIKSEKKTKTKGKS